MKPTDLARYLTLYLTSYLPVTRGLSTNTIASRRDSFSLLLEFLRDKKKLPTNKVDISMLSVEIINEFLQWLENSRGSSISTRNFRLSSLKAFFGYLQTKTPDYIYLCQQIAGIPLKKAPQKGIRYPTLDGIKAILDTVEITTTNGYRDLVLLSVLYDSGARVQEIADLTVGSVRLQSPATLRLTGKGNKTRVIPLMEPTVKLLRQYFEVNNLNTSQSRNRPLFVNRSGTKLTRAGISYILKKYVDLAKFRNSAVLPDTISAHSFRHGKAMHMLQAGVPLIYIRDFLGHAEISTTEIYARCDSKQKREAFEAVYPQIHDSELPKWQANIDLLSWLKSLC